MQQELWAQRCPIYRTTKKKEWINTQHRGVLMSGTPPPSIHLLLLCHSSPGSPTRFWGKMFILHQHGMCLLSSLLAPYCFWFSWWLWWSSSPMPSTDIVPARPRSTRNLCKLLVGWGPFHHFLWDIVFSDVPRRKGRDLEFLYGVERMPGVKEEKGHTGKES